MLSATFFKVPTISSQLISLLTNFHVAVFLIFLITKICSDQFGVEPFAKIFLLFDMLTVSQILNLGSLSLISLLESTSVLDFTSTSFILIVLRYIRCTMYLKCTNFPSLFVEYNFITLFIECKIICFYLLIFYLVCVFIDLKFLKSISNCTSFLFYKGITHTYLL